MPEITKLPEPDAEGYYTFPFSKYNIVTVDGVEMAQSVIDPNLYYELKSLLVQLEKIKERDSHIYCEYGSPKLLEGVESGARLQRAVEIRLENVCTVIDPKSVDINSNAEHVTITGRVKLTGPSDNAIKTLIESGATAFGMRALTDIINSADSSVHIRKLKTIVTWDLVPTTKGDGCPLLGETVCN